MRTHINWNSLKWHLVEGLVTYDFTLHLRVCDHTTWFWGCLGTTFGHFLLGSHNFMVIALGSCVKVALIQEANVLNLTSSLCILKSTYISIQEKSSYEQHWYLLLLHTLAKPWNPWNVFNLVWNISNPSATPKLKVTKSTVGKQSKPYA